MELNKKNQKGFTFTELLMTLVLITIGIFASIRLITFSFSRTMELPPRLIASYLAQEGVEVIKRIRDNNWIEIKTCLEREIDLVRIATETAMADNNITDDEQTIIDNHTNNLLVCEGNEKWLEGLLIHNSQSYTSITGRLNYDSLILEKIPEDSHNLFNLYYLPCDETHLLPNCGSFHHNNPIDHTGTIFNRKINLIIDTTRKQLTITITVRWTERGEWLDKNKSITTTKLYEWYPITTTP